MKRIAYADAVVGTDVEVADLVLAYAGRLADLGRADTVHISAVPEHGEPQVVALLLGPASQITVYEDGAPFDVDASSAVADLRRRLDALSAEIPASADQGMGTIDDFDELDDPGA